MLAIWFGSGHVRNVIIWNFQHTVHVIVFTLSHYLRLSCNVVRLLVLRIGNQVYYYMGMTLYWLALFLARRSNIRVLFLVDWIQQRLLSGVNFLSMISLQEYSGINNLTYHLLAYHETILLDTPTVYPKSLQHNLFSGTWSIEIPEVRAFEIPNSEIMGKCDFVFTRKHCLHHDLYQFQRDFTAEEMHGMCRINAQKKLFVRYCNSYELVENLPEAISLIGSASANYVHWLTETAPKLAMIDEISSLNCLPLIIDDDLHSNILESLRYLNKHNRSIISIKRGQICKVDRLIVLSPVAYVPFDYKPEIKLDQMNIDPGWAIFVPRGLHALRNRLLQCISDCDRGSPVKLFVRRTSRFRQMQNAADLEVELQNKSFQVVEPESLSFADQVKIFSRAEIIVAQAGAALGNMIFAPEACHIVCLVTLQYLLLFFQYRIAIRAALLIFALQSRYVG